MKFRSIALALTCVPGLLFAQRGGGGGGGGGGVRRPTAGFSGAEDSKKEAKALTTDDIRDANPVHLLIDKRKDLKLSDEQLSALKDSESKLKDSTASLFKTIDSLNMAMRIAANASDDEEGSRALVRQDRLKIAVALSSIRAAYDAATQEHLARLTPDQQKTANDLLQKQRDDLDKKTRERLGGRGG